MLTSSSSRRRVLLGLAAGPFLAPQAFASAKTATLTAEETSRVDLANTYLSSVTSVYGRFRQTDARGVVSTGQIWLRRPGRARFQYDPPSELVVVSDGLTVVVNDRKLKTFDQYPLAATPLKILLAKQVRLDKSVAIEGVAETDLGFAITARDGRKQSNGAIILSFAADPMALTGWTVVDGQGQRTQVSLSGLDPVSEIDAKLFVLRDPRPGKGRP
jgi:outer membrane lipoprotein-sorting protein